MEETDRILHKQTDQWQYLVYLSLDWGLSASRQACIYIKLSCLRLGNIYGMKKYPQVSWRHNARKGNHLHVNLPHLPNGEIPVNCIQGNSCPSKQPLENNFEMRFL